MAELHINRTKNAKIEFPSFDLPQNYSILINKLEQLALGLDSALGNFTVDRKEYEIASVATTKDGDNIVETNEFYFGNTDPIASGRLPPPRVQHAHGITETEEYSRVVSDIWIGVILTLLIVSVIFFICACFLYHKFQQWKNSYRTNGNQEPIEVCRRCPPDYEVESLPSYTIVSGLPTYDDALEEFRKAGIILTPNIVPIIKIFEADAKEPQQTTISGFQGSTDNVSLTSTCTCGASNNNTITAAATAITPSLTIPFPNAPGFTAANSAVINSQIIELSPEHLAALSQKRFSLQIAFNNSTRRSSRPRIDLRNNLLRSRAAGNTAGLSGPITQTLDANLLPPIYRSTSVNSLASNDQGVRDCRIQLQHLQHRGSLC